MIHTYHIKDLTRWFLMIALSFLVGVALAHDEPPKISKKLPRMYEGAPPLVPHDVEVRKGVCQACHGTGEIGAPITPHPARIHFCVQCHVGQDLTVKPFVKGKEE